jgi:hypothetical protein
MLLKNILPSFFLLSLCCYSSIFYSQILNIEDPTLPLDSIKKHDLKMGFALSGNISQQQTLVYDATALSEWVYHYNDQHQVLLNGQYITTGSNGNTLINSGYAYLRYTPRFHSAFTPQLFAQFQNDINRGLWMRQLQGANLRWIAKQTSQLQITLASGIFYEKEQWNLSGGSDISAGKAKFQQYKLNQNLRIFWQPNPHFEITWNQFLQFHPQFQSGNNYRWSSQISTSIALSKRISLQINFSSMYDTQPVISIPKFYFNSAYGISFAL